MYGLVCGGVCVEVGGPFFISSYAVEYSAKEAGVEDTLSSSPSSSLTHYGNFSKLFSLLA